MRVNDTEMSMRSNNEAWLSSQSTQVHNKHRPPVLCSSSINDTDQTHRRQRASHSGVVTRRVTTNRRTNRPVTGETLSRGAEGTRCPSTGSSLSSAASRVTLDLLVRGGLRDGD